jgi:hypothetical protein
MQCSLRVCLRKPADCGKDNPVPTKATVRFKFHDVTKSANSVFLQRRHWPGGKEHGSRVSRASCDVVRTMRSVSHQPPALTATLTADSNARVSTATDARRFSTSEHWRDSLPRTLNQQVAGSSPARLICNQEVMGRLKSRPFLLCAFPAFEKSTFSNLSDAAFCIDGERATKCRA